MKFNTNAQFKINDFVYDAVRETNTSSPTIVPIRAETYSQCYEDIIIESLVLAAVATGKAALSDVTYVDIGANHPISTSASYLFYRHYGMRGILVEANPNLIEELKSTRPGDVVIESAIVTTDVDTVDFYIGKDTEVSGLIMDVVDNWKQQHQARVTVAAKRIDAVLAQALGQHIILTVDAEGYDYEILNDIDFTQHRPWIIQVEQGDILNPGLSQLTHQLLAQHGYILIAQTDINQIYMMP